MSMKMSPMASAVAVVLLALAFNGRVAWASCYCNVTECTGYNNVSCGDGTFQSCYSNAYCSSYTEQAGDIALTLDGAGPKTIRELDNVIQDAVKVKYDEHCATGENYKICCPGAIGHSSNSLTGMVAITTSQVSIEASSGSATQTSMIIRLKPEKTSALCASAIYSTTVTTTTAATTASNAATDSTVSAADNAATDSTVSAAGDAATDSTVSAADNAATDSTVSAAGNAATDSTVSAAGDAVTDSTVSVAGNAATDSTVSVEPDTSTPATPSAEPATESSAEPTSAEVTSAAAEDSTTSGGGSGRRRRDLALMDLADEMDEESKIRVRRAVATSITLSASAVNSIVTSINLAQVITETLANNSVTVTVTVSTAGYTAAMGSIVTPQMLTTLLLPTLLLVIADALKK